MLATYSKWLKRQPLAQRTRDAYLAQVSGFVSWLADSGHGAQALSEPHVRDWAVRDYKRHVKTKGRWAPTSVNQALAAIDNLYRSRGIGRPEVGREELAQVAPRALEAGEQRAFLRAVERSPLARDRAIATVFLYTGIRLAELAARCSVVVNMIVSSFMGDRITELLGVTLSQNVGTSERAHTERAPR